MQDSDNAVARASETTSGPDGDATPRVALAHWFFRRMQDLYFCLSENDQEPTVVAKYDKNDVMLTLKGVAKEFKIADDSDDGRMLEQVAKGLRYVKALRLGDELPKEILTREASWALSGKHQQVAYQRVSLQLVHWMSGDDSMITDPEQLLQLADDPATKKLINSAFGKVAERLGYGLDQKERVIEHVEQLARELAYIEALRDQFRRVKLMDHKIKELRRIYGREKSVLEIADQVARLAQKAVIDFEKMFLEIDAQTGEILPVLKNLDAQVPYIRDKRDELHIRLMAWDDLLERWQRAELAIDRQNPNLLRDTYKFLAPRFMVVKEWVLVTQLSQGGGENKKKLGGSMKW